MRATDVFPGPPPADALAYFRSKSLQPAFDHREVWKEDHARAFTVAKATEINVLRNIRDELDRALANGLTFEEFQKNLQPMLEKQGWWGKKTVTGPDGQDQLVQLGSPRRLRLIYDTNMRVARAAGQWDRIQRTKRVRGFLVYELGPSERHRPAHVAWAGVLLPVDHPFWAKAFPPNGWGCKCKARQVARAEAERMGGVTDPAPVLEAMTWTKNDAPENRLAGTKGIDPGWDYNPGAAPRRVARTTRNDRDQAADVLRDRLSLSARTGVKRMRGQEDTTHQLGGAEALRRLAQGRAAHVFDPGVDLDALVLETFQRGKYLGLESPALLKRQGVVPREEGAKTHRFRLEFDEPIGRRLQYGFTDATITTLEVRARQDRDGTWVYHAIPHEDLEP